jgi:hypothetical protein
VSLIVSQRATRLAHLEGEVREFARWHWTGSMDSGHEFLHRVLSGRQILDPIPPEEARRLSLLRDNVLEELESDQERAWAERFQAMTDAELSAWMLNALWAYFVEAEVLFGRPGGRERLLAWARELTGQGQLTNRETERLIEGASEEELVALAGASAVEQ